MKKIIITMLLFTFLLSPISYLWPQDLPEDFIGPGNRDYLNHKIKNGYVVEVFTDLENRQKTLITKKNQAEQIVANSYQANTNSANGIQAANAQRSANADIITWVVEQNQKNAKLNATNGAEFKYIKYSDGRLVRFTRGLATSIENERVVDEFGNVSYKNTYIVYNERRLPKRYTATLRDKLGNVTRHEWSGEWMPEAKYYATNATNATKNLKSYSLKEIAPTGNTKETSWEALSYNGRFLQAFSQTITETIENNKKTTSENNKRTSSFTRSNIAYETNHPERPTSYHEKGKGADGLDYELDRNNVTYNGKGQTTGFLELKWVTQLQAGKTKTTTEAKFEYLGIAHQFDDDVETPDPDRLKESLIITTVEEPDGSRRKDKVTTTYDYEGNQLKGASGNSTFEGNEAEWFDAKTQKLQKGNDFKGSSPEIKYEIFFGELKVSLTHSKVSYYTADDMDIPGGIPQLIRTETSTTTSQYSLKNNLPRLESTHEHTNIIYPLKDKDPTGKSQEETRNIDTNYEYDANGNLKGAKGTGTAGSGGYELTAEGWQNFESDFDIDYTIIFDEAKQKSYVQTKKYPNKKEVDKEQPKPKETIESIREKAKNIK